MPDTVEHCGDLQGDRAIGTFWERVFCKMAAQQDKMMTAHQIDRKSSATAWSSRNGKWHPLTLPDVTVWSAPGEHHEIKHKAATNSGCFGLEDYRLRALKWFSDETAQSVLYTIHRHDWAGGRDVKINNIGHWVTADVCALWLATLDGTARSASFNSYVGGEKRRVPGWFWPDGLWAPLAPLWEIAA